MRRAFAIALTLLAAACGQSGSPSEAPDEEPSRSLFFDRAADWGVDFVHFNGMTGDLFYPEMMGSGCALFDYDADGDLDLYLVQGAHLGDGEPLVPSEGTSMPADRLLRNDLSRAADGTLSGGFTDVTERAGIDALGYGMGVAVADVDLDGALDLYVTNLGANLFLRNLGNGRFSDQTRESGSADEGWGVPALFFDYDLDQLPDLFVGNYVDYSPAADRHCFGPAGARDYCGPTAYSAAADRLFRNLGGGRFEDVTVTAGVGRRGRTLGALAADLDHDGRPDLYVANDGEPNFLWLNRGLRFEEGALAAGLAVDAEGRPQASMGLVGADVDADGDEDLLVTHLTGESHALYLAAGEGRYVDRAQSSGLAVASLPLTGFGAAAVDFDGDGRLDLFAVNGAVRHQEALVRVGDPFPLAQPKQLLRNLGTGRFEVVVDDLLLEPAVGRGVAAGDVDNDGSAELLVSNNNGSAQLLSASVPPSTEWIGLDMRAASGRAGLEGEPFVAIGRRDGSYASASDSRVVLRLGAARAAAVRVETPRGRLLLREVPAGHYLVIRR